MLGEAPGLRVGVFFETRIGAYIGIRVCGSGFRGFGFRASHRNNGSNGKEHGK